VRERTVLVGTRRGDEKDRRGFGDRKKISVSTSQEVATKRGPRFLGGKSDGLGDSWERNQDGLLNMKEQKVNSQEAADRNYGGLKRGKEKKLDRPARPSPRRRGGFHRKILREVH